jgi:ABC-type lipoprotein release transport system permease subunit
MAIPLSYSYRNLWQRKLTTLLTVLGIALVVFVFAAVLMLDNGLRQTLVSTGSDDNLVVLRRAASSDVLSILDRDSARLIQQFPEVARTEGNKPITSTDMVVIINLTRVGTNGMGNVIVRGVSPETVMPLRKQVKIVQGRVFESGKTEIIVGSSIAKRFQGTAVGQKIKFASREWEVVGIFEAERSGFESEIWGDVEQMMAAFNRQAYSTITVRMANPNQDSAFKTRFESEPRLKGFEFKKEKEYFAQQAQGLGTFLKALGLVITAIFSFGAMIGAMITMYAAVANRTVEIGTLRSLGFGRISVLIAFLAEALFIALLGATLGLFLASFLQTVTISTLNFATFSELAFGFDLSTAIVVSCFIFAIVMGIVGGFLPAVRASRLKIVNALRSE